MDGILYALGEKSSACDGFRAAPGRNASTEPGSARKACRDGVGHLPLELDVGLAAEIARLHRISAALAGDDRRIAKQLRDARAVDASPTSPGCVGPRAIRSAHRAPEPGLYRHPASAREIRRTAPRRYSFNSGSSRIVPREDAFGDYFDPGVARDLRAEADAIADGLADALAQRFRHPLGAGAGCDAAAAPA